MKHESQINIFHALFRGREDVFAVRWEKSGKSGYMPSYQYDPYHYRLHKISGGTFANYSHKTCLPLTDNEIQKHLNGAQQIGVYPLLQDNTSWFLVADFDKQNWKEETVNFLNACNEKNIPAYLERSRSGNGGHVWIFFDSPYPAIRSRKIFISILEHSGAFSMFDKGLSFDRLFPNQDFLSGKGLGNLIALPFFKPAMDNGNSCFVNPETFEPIPNQWQFLNKIERVSIEVLDKLFQEISTNRNSPINYLASFGNPNSHNGILSITLHKNIRIQRDGLNTPLINFLKEEMNFANSEFFIKKKSGKNTFGTERYFKLVEETESEIIIPRGFVGKLLRFCKEQNLDFNFQDHRKLKEEITFTFNAIIRSSQKKEIDCNSSNSFIFHLP